VTNARSFACSYGDKFRGGFLPGGDTSVKYVTKRDSPDAKGIAWEMKEFRASPSFSSSKCSERKYKRSCAAQTLAMLSHRSPPPRISRFFCITRYFFAIPKPEPRINSSLELSPMTASRYLASLETVKLLDGSRNFSVERQSSNSIAILLLSLLAYLNSRCDTRYIFFSSGSDTFLSPSDIYIYIYIYMYIALLIYLSTLFHENVLPLRFLLLQKSPA